jgi:hypothetical protein
MIAGFGGIADLQALLPTPNSSNSCDKLGLLPVVHVHEVSACLTDSWCQRLLPMFCNLCILQRLEGEIANFAKDHDKRVKAAQAKLKEAKKVKIRSTLWISRRLDGTPSTAGIVGPMCCICWCLPDMCSRQACPLANNAQQHDNAQLLSAYACRH